MGNVKQYRKKPVIIEAVMFSYTNGEVIAQWCSGEYVALDSEGYEGFIKIDTLEGIMIAKEGDYIIKGVAGEFYPCKPDIFAKTYEEVSND